MTPAEILGMRPHHKPDLDKMIELAKRLSDRYQQPRTAEMVLRISTLEQRLEKLAGKYGARIRKKPKEGWIITKNDRSVRLC